MAILGEIIPWISRWAEPRRQFLEFEPTIVYFTRTVLHLSQDCVRAIRFIRCNGRC